MDIASVQFSLIEERHEKSPIGILAKSNAIQWAALIGITQQPSELLRSNSLPPIAFCLLDIASMDVSGSVDIFKFLLDHMPLKIPPNEIDLKNRRVEAILVTEQLLSCLSLWKAPWDSLYVRIGGQIVKTMESLSRQDDCKTEALVALSSLQMRSLENNEAFFSKRIVRHFQDVKKGPRSLEILVRSCSAIPRFKMWNLFEHSQFTKPPILRKQILITPPTLPEKLIHLVLQEIFEKSKSKIFGEVSLDSLPAAFNTFLPMFTISEPLTICAHWANYAAQHDKAFVHNYIVPQLSATIGSEDFAIFKFNSQQAYRTMLALLLVRRTLSPWVFKPPILHIPVSGHFVSLLQNNLATLMQKFESSLSSHAVGTADYPLIPVVLVGPHLDISNGNGIPFLDGVGDPLHLPFQWIDMAETEQPDQDNGWRILTEDKEHVLKQYESSRRRLALTLRKRNSYFHMVEVYREVLFTVPVLFFAGNSKLFPSLSLLLHIDWSISCVASFVLQMVIAKCTDDETRIKIFNSLINHISTAITPHASCIVPVLTYLGQLVTAMRIWAHVRSDKLQILNASWSRSFIFIALEVLVIPCSKVREYSDCVLDLVSVIWPHYPETIQIRKLLLQTHADLTVRHKRSASDKAAGVAGGYPSAAITGHSHSGPITKMEKKTQTRFNIRCTSELYNVSDNRFLQVSSGDEAFDEYVSPSFVDIHSDAWLLNAISMCHELIHIKGIPTCIHRVQISLAGRLTQDPVLAVGMTAFERALRRTSCCFIVALSSQKDIEQPALNISLLLWNSALNPESANSKFMHQLEETVGMSVSIAQKSRFISLFGNWFKDTMENSEEEEVSAQISKGFFSWKAEREIVTTTKKPMRKRVLLSSLRIIKYILQYRVDVAFPNWQSSLQYCFTFLADKVKSLNNQAWSQACEFTKLVSQCAQTLKACLLNEEGDVHTYISTSDAIWPRAARRELWTNLQKLSGFHEVPFLFNINKTQQDEEQTESVSERNMDILRATSTMAAIEMLKIGPTSLGAVGHKPDDYLWSWFFYGIDKGELMSSYLTAHWPVGEMDSGDTFAPFVDRWYVETQLGRNIIFNAIYQTLQTWLYTRQSGKCVRSLEPSAAGPIAVLALLVCKTHTDPDTRTRALRILATVEGGSTSLVFHPGSELYPATLSSTSKQSISKIAITASTTLCGIQPTLANTMLSECCNRTPSVLSDHRQVEDIVEIMLPWCHSPGLKISVNHHRKLFNFELLWTCLRMMYRHSIHTMQLFLPLLEAVSIKHGEIVIDFLLTKLQGEDIQNQDIELTEDYLIASCLLSGIALFVFKTHPQIIMNQLTGIFFSVKVNEWKLLRPEQDVHEWVTYALDDPLDNLDSSELLYAKKIHTMHMVQSSILTTMHPCIFSDPEMCSVAFPQMLAFSLCSHSREHLFSSFILQLAIKQKLAYREIDGKTAEHIEALHQVAKKNPADFEPSELRQVVVSCVELLSTTFSPALVDSWCQCLLLNMLGIYDQKSFHDTSYMCRTLAIYNHIRSCMPEKPLQLRVKHNLSEVSAFRLEVLTLLKVMYQGIWNHVGVVSATLECLLRVCLLGKRNFPVNAFSTLVHCVYGIYASGEEIDRVQKEILSLVIAVPNDCILVTRDLLERLTDESLDALLTREHNPQLGIFYKLACRSNEACVYFISMFLCGRFPCDQFLTDELGLPTDQLLIVLKSVGQVTRADRIKACINVLVEVAGLECLIRALCQCTIVALGLHHEYYVTATCVAFASEILQHTKNAPLNFFVSMAKEKLQLDLFGSMVPGASTMLQACSGLVSISYGINVPGLPDITRYDLKSSLFKFIEKERLDLKNILESGEVKAVEAFFTAEKVRAECIEGGVASFDDANGFTVASSEDEETVDSDCEDAERQERIDSVIENHIEYGNRKSIHHPIPLVGRQHLLEILRDSSKHQVIIGTLFKNNPTLDENYFKFAARVLQFQKFPVHNDAVELFNTYLKPDAMDSIIVPIENRIKTRNQLENINVSMFDDSFEVALKYLHQNFLYRYLRSVLVPR